MAGFADRRRQAERARIGQSDLNLRCGAARSDNGHIDRLFRADDIDAFLAGILTGLRQLLFIVQLRTLAKQRFQVLLRLMQMTRRSLKNNRICHILNPPIAKLWYSSIVRFVRIFFKRFAKKSTI